MLYSLFFLAFARAQITPALPETTCTHAFGSENYNLAALAYSQGVGDERVVTAAGLFTLNPCGLSTTQGECAEKGGSACLYTNPTGGVMNEFLGVVAKWDNNVTWNEITKPTHGGVSISFNNGDTCAGGKNGKFSLDLTLNCDPDQANPKPDIFITSKSNCEFYGEGSTLYACPSSVIDPQKLSAGVAKSSEGPKQYFFIDSGVNSKELNVHALRTDVLGSGTWGLYVRLEGLPTSSEYDFFSQGDFSQLNVTVPVDKLLPSHKYIILVESQNSMNFSITAEDYVCPGAGDCSGHGICQDGVCNCADGYVTPALDCSASISDVTLPASEDSAVSSSSVQYYRVSTGASGAALVATLTVAGDVATYPISISWRMDDFPTDQFRDGFETITNPNVPTKLQFNFPPANQVFIIAVRGSINSEAIPFHLEVSLQECPQDCSNNGACVPRSSGGHECECDNGFSGLACSFSVVQIDGSGDFKMTPLATETVAVSIPPQFVRVAADFSLQLTAKTGSLPLVFACWGFGTACDASGYDYKINPNGAGTSTILYVPGFDTSTQTISEGDNVTMVISFFNEMSTDVEFTYKASSNWKCPNCELHGGECTEDKICVCPPGRLGTQCEISSSKVEHVVESTGESSGITAFLVILFFSVSIGLGICMVQQYDICESCCDSKFGTLGGVTYQANTVNSAGAYYGTTDDI